MYVFVLFVKINFVRKREATFYIIYYLDKPL